MHETSDDLDRLQTLLERSRTAAGDHLREVAPPEWHLDARSVCARLTGMRLLAVATVTSDGRPLVGPVDGIFYRGAFHFGSSPSSVRLRHLRRRPAVSATHAPGEELAVTVHGRAQLVDVAATDQAGFRRTLLDIYTPRFGPEWESFMDGASYVRIDAERMIALAPET
jgi:hypothetical protein